MSISLYLYENRVVFNQKHSPLFVIMCEYISKNSRQYLLENNVLKRQCFLRKNENSIDF